MDNLDKKNTLKQIFLLSGDDKNDLINNLQYLAISILPIFIIYQLFNNYVPQPDPTKSTIEILIEILLHILIVFIFIFFINRIVINIPTYTNTAYPTIDLIQTILIFLFLIFSFQNTISNKANILYNRLIDYWYNKKTNNKKKSNNGSSSSTTSSTIQSPTPISQQPTQVVQPIPSAHYPTSSIEDNPPQQPMMENFHSMSSEPVPANSVLGGSMFSSSNW